MSNAGTNSEPRGKQRYAPWLVLLAVLLVALAVQSVRRPESDAGSSVPGRRPADAEVRVGIQAGHWRRNEMPDEFGPGGSGTGTAAGGYTEVEVNVDIARRAASILRGDGITVDVLPATIPAGYEADAFVALHADGSPSARPRGFKLAAPRWAPPESERLLELVTEEYAAATAMPRNNAITRDMTEYYAFNYRRFRHAISPTTPGVILEMGFLTNPADRAVMTRRADDVASGIADGIRRYLREQQSG